MTQIKDRFWPTESREEEERGNFLFRYLGEPSSEATPRSLVRSASCCPEALLKKEMLSLYRSVENLLPDPAQKTLQFIGSHEGAGVSSLVRAFAITATERLGKSVLVVDAAHHNPSQHLHFDLVEALSWCDVVKSGECAEKACHQVGGSTLFLSPAPPEVAADLEFPSVGSFLGELRNSFHYILIDSSPPTVSPESLSLSRHVDGVVLVVEADRTRWPVALALKEQAEQSGGRVLGMIFNKRRHHIPDFLYRRL